MSNNEFQIQASTNVLWLRYDENWPLEKYKNRFGNRLIARAKDLHTKEWAVIDDISNWPVKIPEEMDMCIDLGDSLVKIGFSHCAVFGHQYAISKWLMKKVLPDEVEIGFFDTLEQSQEWLTNLGYDTDFK